MHPSQEKSNYATQGAIIVKRKANNVSVNNIMASTRVVAEERKFPHVFHKPVENPRNAVMPSRIVSNAVTSIKQ